MPKSIYIEIILGLQMAFPKIYFYITMIIMCLRFCISRIWTFLPVFEGEKAARWVNR